MTIAETADIGNELAQDFGLDEEYIAANLPKKRKRAKKELTEEMHTRVRKKRKLETPQTACCISGCSKSPGQHTRLELSSHNYQFKSTYLKNDWNLICSHHAKISNIDGTDPDAMQDDVAQPVKPRKKRVLNLDVPTDLPKKRTSKPKMDADYETYDMMSDDDFKIKKKKKKRSKESELKKQVEQISRALERSQREVAKYKAAAAEKQDVKKRKKEDKKAKARREALEAQANIKKHTTKLNMKATKPASSKRKKRVPPMHFHVQSNGMHHQHQMAQDANAAMQTNTQANAQMANHPLRNYITTIPNEVTQSKIFMLDQKKHLYIQRHLIKLQETRIQNATASLASLGPEDPKRVSLTTTLTGLQTHLADQVINLRRMKQTLKEMDLAFQTQRQEWKMKLDAAQKRLEVHQNKTLADWRVSPNINPSKMAQVESYYQSYRVQLDKYQRQQLETLDGWANFKKPTNKQEHDKLFEEHQQRQLAKQANNGK